MRRDPLRLGCSEVLAVLLVAAGAGCGGTPPEEATAREAASARVVSATPRVTPDPASLPGPGGYFGRVLALSGDLLAVGAYQQAASAVYLYQRVGAGWRELQVIQGSNYYFGRSLALQGEVLAIGDPGLGRVTVHRQDGAVFRLEATLEVAGGAERAFGQAVALDGETLFVGEPGGEAGGVVHLYGADPATGTWGPAGQLTPAARAPWDQFGFALAASGRVLAVTALTSSPPATTVFRRGPAGWIEEAWLPDPEDEEQYTFGHKVALAGRLLVVNCACGDGEAHVYEWTWRGWRLAATLRGSAEAYGYFADGIATDGRTIVASAPGDPAGGLSEVGSVTVFQRGRTGWGPVARLVAPTLVADDWFGHAVALEDGLVVVGAPGTQEADGEVYTFLLQERGPWGWPRR